MVHELAKLDPRVVFIGSDLRPNLLADMKAEFPDRYFMEGVSEQHIVGFAAGLALDGFIPFINTIGTFLTRRCFDQIAVALCMHNVPVRLIGSGGGFVYAPLGPTHQAIDDIAIMRALPNMTVVAVADADEMAEMMWASLEWPHPIYIRLGKGGEEKVTSKDPFFFGQAVPLRMDLELRDENILFVTTGVMGARALKAANLIEAEREVSCEVLHMPTIKPFDAQYLSAYAARAKIIVTVEDHSLIGGLGSAVNDALIQQHHGWLPKILNMGVPGNQFIEDYGNQEHLLTVFGLQPEQIAAKVIEALS